jgi:acyl-CoA synthetase (AMP-forming)/AMP-acid ligase II
MPFKSQFADIEVPDVPITQFLLERAASFGDAPALIDGASDRTITYSQLKPMIQKVFYYSLYDYAARCSAAVSLFSKIPNPQKFYFLQVAGGLRKAGLEKGDVFAIMAPNLPEYAVSFLFSLHIRCVWIDFY